MLESIESLSYVIVLCEDIDRMKAFYKDVFNFPVETDSPTDLSLRAGPVMLALRKRTRDYDGQGTSAGSPGLQIAFRVAPELVEPCHAQLVKKGVTILDPPTDQPRGHRTVYFADPEGNLLEIYAEI